MAKGDELVKYITEQVVGFINTPKEAKRLKRAARESWQTRWFGLLPLALLVWGHNRQERRQQRIKIRNLAKTAEAKKSPSADGG